MLHLLKNGDFVAHEVVGKHAAVLAEQLLLKQLLLQDLGGVQFVGVDVLTQVHRREGSRAQLLLDLILVDLIEPVEGPA